MFSRLIRKLPLWLQGDRLAPWIVFIIVYLLYEVTGAKGIFWGDAGEFLAVARTLGIGHPYGHPLFWLLGRLSIILTPSNPVSAMTHLTALTGAGTATGVALLAREFLLEESTFRIKMLIIITTALTFAVMETVWIQATFIEVYHLQALLVVLTLVFFKRYISGNNIKFLYLSAYLFGLAVTLGIYVLLIALLPLFILVRQRFYLKGFSFKHAICLLFFFVLSLSVWLYLPFRSASHPPFAWVDIHSWSTFHDYLSRQMYNQFAVPGIVAWKISLQQTIRIILKNVGIWGGFLLLLWVWLAIKGEKVRQIWPYPVTALLILLTFSFLIPLNLSFRQMVDMDVYFLPVLILLIPVLTDSLQKLRVWLKSKFVYFILLPVLLTIFWQWPYIDLSNKNLAARFQQYLLDNIPANSTLHLTSDEVAYPLFNIVYAGSNPKHFQVPVLHEIRNGAVIDSSAGIQPPFLFELHKYFLDNFTQNYAFVLAGPLVVYQKDSAIAVNLEKEFIRQFNPEVLDITTLNRQDRLNLARIWARRGVYWFKMYFYVKTADSVRRENLKRALTSFQFASQFDDFSLEGALHAANLAITLTWNNEFTKAEIAARKALKLNSYSSLAHRANYYIAVQQQAYDKALYHFKKVIYLSSANAQDYIKLATLYLLNGKLEEGRSAYQKALSNGAPPQPHLEERLNISDN